MAQHTIIENIHRNTEDWFAVKEAVRGKGVDCPDDTPTADVAGKIEDIETYANIFKSVIEGTVTNIAIPDGTTKITAYAFYRIYSLANVSIPSSVQEIGERAFEDTSIESDYPDTIYMVVDNCLLAIRNTYLQEIEIPDSVRVIASRCMEDADATTSTKLIIPGSVKNIPEFAFFDNNSDYNSSIASLIVNEGVETFYEGSLTGLQGLTTIVFPESLVELKDHAAGSSSLHIIDIYYRGTEAQWNEVVIGSDNDLILNATMHYEYTGDGSEL